MAEAAVECWRARTVCRKGTQTTTVLKDYVLDQLCLRQNGGKNGLVGANNGEDREC